MNVQSISFPLGTIPFWVSCEEVHQVEGEIGLKIHLLFFTFVRRVNYSQGGSEQ